MKKGKQILLQATPTVTFSITNPATDKKPTTIYSGVSSVLDLKLNNLTGADIIVTNQSSLEIFMPGYFTADEVKNISISGIAAGWTGKYNQQENTLLITYSGTDVKWNKDTSFLFSINNVKCAETSGSDTLQINLDGLRGVNIPLQVSAALVVSIEPVPTRLNLPDALKAQTEYNGIIYVSSAIDPLTNTLFINLKNTGDTPIYNGIAPRSDNPKITVSFVYGSTGGALAPEIRPKEGEKGSAWSISCGIASDQTGGWLVKNPKLTDAGNSPVWILTPAATNKNIFGIKEHANLSLEFRNILSFTPPGATQAYLSFSGFTQSEQNKYNDCVFVVDILKREPPHDRGVQSIYSEEPTYFIREKGNVTAEMYWKIFQSTSVKLSTSAVPPPAPYSKTYKDPPPLIYDHTALVFPAVEPNTVIVCTMQAYDGAGKQLKPDQYSVSFKQQPGIYAFSGPQNSSPYTMNDQASFVLNWKTYLAARIEICKGDVQLYEKSYTLSRDFVTDNTTISIAAPGTESEHTLTLKTYDAQNVLIESSNCIVKLSANAWRDPKDSKVYPIVRADNKIWLGSNYDYNDPLGGSYWFDNNQRYEATYGRLYTYESAKRIVPAGWRLPVNADWTSLIKSVPAPSALLPDGASGMNLQFGGLHYVPEAGGTFYNIGNIGFYLGIGKKATTVAYLQLWRSDSRILNFDMPYPFCMFTCIDTGSLRFILGEASSASSKEQEEEEIPIEELEKRRTLFVPDEK